MMAMMKSALNVEERSGVEWMKRNGWETLEESAAAHARHVLVGLYVEKCMHKG